MDLKSEYIKLPKDDVYGIYLKIVYNFKSYGNVSRSKMLDEIIDEYNNNNNNKLYLYHICTNKELEFLNYIKSNKLKPKDLDKYHWEIKTLNEKCIFSLVNLDVFDEQRKNVDEALELWNQNKNKKENAKELAIFAVSFVKINGYLLTSALNSMLMSICDMSEEDANNFLGHPLFHFYCGFQFQNEYDYDFKQEIAFYRDYYHFLDEIEEKKKDYGISGKLNIDIRDIFDIFYYGFPIRNSKVKKMYDLIKKKDCSDFLFCVIDEARALNSYSLLKVFFPDEEYNIIIEALFEMPHAALNGFTPSQYMNELDEAMKLDSYFDNIPQNNAHLCKREADHYYKLYLALMDYVNKEKKIRPEIKKIYKQDGIDVNKLKDIDEYLWSHKEMIDDFIKNNNYNFTEEELKEVAEFKNAVTSKFFVITGFEREYTNILSQDGKLYMVKGLRTDIDKMTNKDELPQVVSTTLLMFNGKIVFNGFLIRASIDLGNEFRRSVIRKLENAITYYHL